MTASKSGRKPAPPEKVVLPPMDPPARLKVEREREVYRELWELCSKAPKFSVCETELLIHLARKIARADRLAELIEGNQEIMVSAGNGGGAVVHPAWRALQSLEDSIQSSLAQLLLTSRSRSSARVASAEKPVQSPLPADPAAKKAKPNAKDRRRSRVLQMFELRNNGKTETA